MFAIDPTPGILSKMDFSSLMNFSCEASYSIKSVTYSKGQLEVHIPYTTDL